MYKLYNGVFKPVLEEVLLFESDNLEEVKIFAEQVRNYNKMEKSPKNHFVEIRTGAKEENIIDF